MDLQDRWNAVRGDLRREFHRASLPIEIFVAICEYGQVWVQAHQAGSAALGHWYGGRKGLARANWCDFEETRNALKELRIPPLTEEQLNAAAAVHAFGFDAFVFAGSSPSFTEGMRRLRDDTSTELAELPVYEDVDQFVRHYGDILERRGAWRDQLILHYDKNFKPTFTSEWDVEVKETPDDAPCLIIDGLWVRLPDGSAVPVSPSEADVLEAFAEVPAMDTAELGTKSGVEKPVEVVRSLKAKFPDFVHMPGRKANGGYRIRVMMPPANHSIPTK